VKLLIAPFVTVISEAAKFVVAPLLVKVSAIDTLLVAAPSLIPEVALVIDIIGCAIPEKERMINM
jgi:hypothetical protein